MTACAAEIIWPDGQVYQCSRDDEHDGMKKMHGAVIDKEWTNWTDDFKW